MSLRAADTRLQTFADEHHGVVTRAAARDAGLSDRQIRHRVESGLWLCRSDRVFVVRTVHARPEQAMLAAAWVVDGPCSHASAAWLHGVLDDAPAVPAVSASRTCGNRWGWLELHRPTELSARDLTRRRGIPVTTVERTLFDLGAVVDLATQRSCIDEALLSRLVHPDRVIRRFQALSTRGRPGSAAARTLLTELEQDRAMTESALESLLVELLRAAGLPAPTLQHEVSVDGRRYRIDIAYPELRVAIEADGFAAHGSRAAFEHDRQRQNDLVLLGWKVLRFTWRQIRADPDAVIAQVRAAIASAETASGGLR